MRYLMKFSYDGTYFYGYQIQVGKRTIQGVIEDALKRINNDNIVKINSSGRTDKGVHALGQVAHFDLEMNITLYKLKCALNSNLPDDIHVISVKNVDNDFHARYMVKSKRYVYKLNMGEYNPIDRNYIYQYCRELDINKMRESLNYLIGQHDFRAFTPSDDKKSDCVKTIYNASIDISNGILELCFVGNGFIKYQIRNMVGALMQVGSLNKPPTYVKEVLDSKNRHNFYKTAPSVGLYLVDVKYDDEFEC